MGVGNLANTTVSILSGTVTDAFGDTIDASTITAEGVPACLVETRETALDVATQTPRTVRSITCWVPPWSGVEAGTEGQQLKDETTGDVYFIESVVRPSTLIGAPVDYRLSLRRVSGPDV